VVAAHSWGAHIALQLAADLPHLVGGLALVDGGWRPYTERFPDLDTAWRRTAPPDLTAFTLDLMPADQQPFRVDSQFLYALFGSARRDGRWVVPAKLPIAALFGTVELDLREAVLQRRHIVLDVSALCGRIHILVPDGVEVRVTGRTVLTSRNLKVRPIPGGDGPVVEIRGTFILGSVKAQGPKRRWRDLF
jgi:pimeloyl-ACP methyl ester carboxylesterase